MRYLLMNKNNIVAAGVDSGIDGSILLEKAYSTLPLGMEELTPWIENRKASKHNRLLQELMKECHCDTLSGFIDVTHAASLNDTFWVKREDDPAKWENISLYTNDFDETISKLAFNGLGAQEFTITSTTPELVGEGSFRRCFTKENNEIYLYKRGTDGTQNAGLEPYGEYIASKIAKILCQQSVDYSLVQLHGIMTTKCQLFTDEERGYAPISSISTKMGIDGILQYMAQFHDGSEERFREMLVLDAITFNNDRHFGNFGVLIDNDTVKPITMAPVFDLNLTLFPYVSTQDLKKRPGDAIYGYQPKLGSDFVRIGQEVLTDNIIHALHEIKNMEIPFHPDSVYTEERFYLIRNMVEKQIDAVLSKEKLRTQDVFYPYELEEQKERQQKAKMRLNDAYQKLEHLETDYSVMLSTVDDLSHQEIYIEEMGAVDYVLTVDFLKNTISAEKNGAKCSLESMPEKFRSIAKEAEFILHPNPQKFIVLCGIPDCGKMDTAKKMMSTLYDPVLTYKNKRHSERRNSRCL